MMNAQLATFKTPAVENEPMVRAVRLAGWNPHSLTRMMDQSYRHREVMLRGQRSVVALKRL